MDSDQAETVLCPKCGSSDKTILSSGLLALGGLAVLIEHRDYWARCNACQHEWHYSEPTLRAKELLRKADEIAQPMAEIRAKYGERGVEDALRRMKREERERRCGSSSKAK
jgi:Zn finger protein HypA/HybF involved in hydrogenase expression